MRLQLLAIAALTTLCSSIHARPALSKSNPPSSRCASNAECLRLGQPLLKPRLDRRFAATVEFDATGGPQSWTVPVSGMYAIEAAGASGGGTDGHGNGPNGGLGAQVNVTYALNMGDTLQIYVGQMGGTDQIADNGGGGGATFVTFPEDGLIVAGGGGGSGIYTPGHDASTDFDINGQDGGGASGGTMGQGGGASDAAGGGGLLSNGADGPLTRAQGGRSYANGLGGGGGGSSVVGGYGGGGQGGGSSGGGGGGYSGGGAGGDNSDNTGYGGAGSSYVSQTGIQGSPVISLHDRGDGIVYIIQVG